MVTLWNCSKICLKALSITRQGLSDHEIKKFVNFCQLLGNIEHPLQNIEYESRVEMTINLLGPLSRRLSLGHTASAITVARGLKIVLGDGQDTIQAQALYAHTPLKIGKIDFMNVNSSMAEYAAMEKLLVMTFLSYLMTKFLQHPIEAQFIAISLDVLRFRGRKKSVNIMVDAYEYCKPETLQKICRPGKMHLECGAPEKKPKYECQKVAPLLPMTKKVKRFLLDLHNAWRDKVAGGEETGGKSDTSFPIATRMRELIWDNELNYLASNQGFKGKQDILSVFEIIQEVFQPIYQGKSEIIDTENMANCSIA
uniref:Uncharacterized protein n=1 Tax=Glossina austeni TaxID=7395 RepID=A0A1A9UYN6_GLOAU